MNLDWLLSFAVFAEHLNLTHAARALHITQPALHGQIRKLADAVGRPLYRREGRALQLTPEGRRLASHARALREQTAQVLAEIRGESLESPVVLVAGRGAHGYLLGPAIRGFPKERWPLRLLTGTGSDALEAVREARAHLGVIAATAPPDGLVGVELTRVGQSVIVPRGHRLARRRKLELGDLAQERLIVAPAGRPHRTMLTTLLAARGVDWEVAVEADGWELMLQFARYGMGLAVVNDFCPAPRGMVAVPLRGVPSTPYYLISRTSELRGGVAALRERIVATLGARSKS